MSATLVDMVRRFNLQPGQSVRESVNGYTAELRLLDDELTPGLAEPEMLERWFEIPFEPMATITACPGPEQLPDPIVIDESDLAPE